MIRYCLGLVLASLLYSPAQAVVSNVIIADFDSTGSPSYSAVTATNSPAGNSSFSAATVVSDPAIAPTEGPNVLRMTDPGGLRNGILVEIPNAIPAAGHYVITADIKVNSTATAPISTFGMGLKLGGPNSTPIDDINAAYIPNLPQNPTNGSALGYQTIGASIRATSGPFPRSVTLYFSTDVSVGPFKSADGDFTGPHRGSGSAWPEVSNTSSVYIDNIRRIGPGNYGEERCMYISIGDSMNNLGALETKIRQAKTEGYNAICILARYRANRFYIKNRNFATYTHSEPMHNSVSNGNDPLQKAIDIGHDEGMKVYAAFSCFLVSDGVNQPYPAHMPTGSITYVYNGGSPRAQNTTDSPEGLWADPGRADVRAHTINVLKDLVENYDIDGVLFDRVRYSGNGNPANLAAGYNPQARADMGVVGVPAPSNSAFINARQEAITTFLHDAYEAVTDMKPWVVVGTTPIAYGNNLSNTYTDVMQSFPKWTGRKTANRTISFGVQDTVHPQFYRQHDSGGANAAPQANRDLIRKAMYGEIGNDPLDFGLMPGANVNLNPLFFIPLPLSSATDADLTAGAIATNICDTRNYPTYASNGFGIYNARPLLTAADSYGVRMTDRIAAKSTACGTDILGTAAPHPDFLMKEGWDSTPPNNLTSVNASANGVTVNLSWSPPGAAADGDVPTRYLVYRSTNSTVPMYYENQRGVTTDITGTSYVDFGGNGNFYYRVVPVDEYNNKATGFVVGPVSMTSDVVLESRLSNGALNTAHYSESGALSDTTSESVMPGVLVNGGSRYGTALGISGTFTPNLPVAGKYNVYVTLATASGGDSPGPSNNANAGVQIINSGSTVNTSVVLAPGPTISNTWKLLASEVQFAAGTSGYIRFTNNGGSGRFCMDAVKFELVAPEQSAVNDWQLYGE